MEWIFLMGEMMNNIKIFFAAPISGFKDELEYRKNRDNLLNIISKLRINFKVYSEILHIGSLASYDEPGASVIKDFNEIKDADVFIIYHPMNMQTSTFIELGYAVAKGKNIIIIGKKNTLPYLALGLSKYSSNIKIISSSELDANTFEKIEILINEFFNVSSD